jgi:hypothetical protein
MSKGGGILGILAPIAAIALPGAGTAVALATKGAELASQLTNQSNGTTPTPTAAGQLGGDAKNNLPVNYGLSQNT